MTEEPELPIRDEIRRLDGNIDGIITQMDEYSKAIVKIDYVLERMDDIEARLELLEHLDDRDRG
jgi:enamine deaminase RidA (YjgF/YER057c/UK114 family)